MSSAGAPDLHLQTDSPCIDQGGFLTTITSASGAGTSFVVDDAGYFMDGWGVVDGDLIQLEDQTTTARLTSVDYGTNTLVVDRTVTFSNGQGVALAYVGAAPDPGAHEFGESVVSDGGTDGGLHVTDGEVAPGDGGRDGADAGEDGKSGGCGCRLGGAAPRGGLALVILALVGVACRSRARRGRRPR